MLCGLDKSSHNKTKQLMAVSGLWEDRIATRTDPNIRAAIGCRRSPGTYPCSALLSCARCAAFRRLARVQSGRAPSVALHHTITPYHCTISLHHITAMHHCTASLHHITAMHHCTASLQHITASLHLVYHPLIYSHSIHVQPRGPFHKTI